MLLEVLRTDEVAAGIREVELAAPDGSTLPAHPAGSHVVVDCAGRRNAYSLTSPGRRPARYRVAVLLLPEGDGGSAFMHRLRPGDRVEVSTPRSAFAPVNTARRHLLVAGGIGVTPMLAHAREAVAGVGERRDVRMLYVHRPGAGAFADELVDLLGDRAVVTSDEDRFGELLATALRDQPLGTHLYVCGPAGLMDRVLREAADAGWPDERLHLERFAALELDPGEPFTVTLARSGRAMPVPAGTSLLEVLEAEGVAVSSLCRQGICGECRIGVRAGTPLHRDEFLTPPEREAGDSIMCCVSRSHGDTLEVDL